MIPNKEALKEFEKLWREENPNKDITPEQLLEMATRVMRAVELIYKRIPQNKVEVPNLLSS